MHKKWLEKSKRSGLSPFNKKTFRPRRPVRHSCLASTMYAEAYQLWRPSFWSILLANTFSLTFACHILTFSDNEHIYSHFRMSCTHFSNNVDPANSPGFPYQSFQLSHAIAVKRLLTYVKRKKIYIGITPNKYDRAPWC